MKGAQPHKIRAAFFQLHMPPHDVDHIRAGDELLDEAVGDGHGKLGLERY